MRKTHEFERGHVQKKGMSNGEKLHEKSFGWNVGKTYTRCLGATGMSLRKNVRVDVEIPIGLRLRYAIHSKFIL